MDRWSASVPALPLAAAAFVAVLFVGAIDAAEIAVAALVAAIILVSYRKDTAALKLFFGAAIIIGGAAYLSRPTPLTDSELAPQTFSGRVVNVSNTPAAQTAIVNCDGRRIRLVVTDLTPELSSGDIVVFSADPQPLGRYQGVPYMRTSSWAERAQRIAATAVVNKDGISIESHSDDFRSRLDDMRRSIADAVYASTLDPQAAALLVASTLGTGDAPTEIKDSYRLTGLSHLLCVSGFHVGLVSAFILALLAPLKRLKKGKLWRYGLALVGVWFYAFLTGFAPPIIRASVMISIYFGARALERIPLSFNALCIAFFVVLFIDPWSLYSAGFQLSFAAVAGLLLLSSKLNPIPTRNTRIRKAVSLLSVPLAATLATAPIVLAWFCRLPLLSIPVNAIATLIFPVFMLAGGLGVLFPCLSPVSKCIFEGLHAVVDSAAAVSETISFTFTPDLLSIAALSGILISLIALLYSTHGRKWIAAALCICILSIGAIPPSEHRVIIDGDSRGTDICIIDGIQASIYPTRNREKPITACARVIEASAKSFIFEKSAICRVGDIVVAESNDIDIHRCDIVILDRKYRDNLSDLVNSAKPSHVIIGADLDYTRRIAYATACARAEIPYTDLHSKCYLEEGKQ